MRTAEVMWRNGRIWVSVQNDDMRYTRKFDNDTEVYEFLKSERIIRESQAA